MDASTDRQPTLAERIVLLALEREQALFAEDLEKVEALGQQSMDELKQYAGIFIDGDPSP